MRQNNFKHDSPLVPGRIPQQFISDLLAQADIVSIIDSRVRLTKSGKEYKACCPFHEEKTPSFFVNPVRQFFYCFGCGKGGTVLNFLMEYSNLDYRTAIEEVAATVGLEVPTEGGWSETDGDIPNLYELMSRAQALYETKLWKSTEAEQARSYIESRNISREIVKKFGLGYAPNQWDFLLKQYGRSKTGRRLLLKSGMVIEKENDKRYDRFRDRLMFPIIDRRDRVIGFGGRIISEGEPKYLNSPETPLFHKSNELFGLNHALPAISSSKRVLVVEGYTDVLALSQYGIEYAVAALGVATTTYHIRELFRSTSQIVFCFDGDEAGRHAARRALEAVLPMMYDGNLVSFVFLPQGQDPDSLVRAEGAAGLEDRISNAIPIADYIFDTLFADVDISRIDGQAKFVTDFETIFRKLPEGFFRRRMSTKVAELVKEDPEILYFRLVRKGRSHGRKRSTPTELPKNSLITRALAILVQNPQLNKFVGNTDHFAGVLDPNINLLIEISQFLNKHQDIESVELINCFRDSELFEQICRLMSLERRVATQDLENELKGIICNLRLMSVKQELKQFENSIESDSDLKRFLTLTKLRQELEKGNYDSDIIDSLEQKMHKKQTVKLV